CAFCPARSRTLIFSCPAALLRKSLLDVAFRRLTHVVIDGFADNAVGELFQVSVQLLRQREKLRPQRLVLKRLRRSNVHRAVSPTMLTVRCQSVPTAKRNKQFSLPRVT